MSTDNTTPRRDGAGPTVTHGSDSDRPEWLTALRTYIAVLAGGNLVWEAAHMPLYTLWREESMDKIVLYGLHCTGGDILIAVATLLASLLTLGHATWPSRRFWPVAAGTLALGLGYTAYSEWWNVQVAQSWAYSEAMPTLTAFDIGLSPLLQWLVVPAAGFWAVRRRTRSVW